MCVVIIMADPVVHMQFHVNICARNVATMTNIALFHYFSSYPLIHGPMYDSTLSDIIATDATAFSSWHS